jgi:hypothetical protein
MAQRSPAIIRSVVGAGGILDAGNDTGDTLSATLGQRVIGAATIDQQTRPTPGHDASTSAMLLSLGFWLPRPSMTDHAAPLPLIAETGTALALRSHPNPFTETTTISYRLPSTGHLRLVIFDAAGRRVRLLVDEPQQGGDHDALWDARDDAGRALATGAYFYRLELTSTAGNSGEQASGERASGTIHFVK